jgi:hypothetical protein
VDDFCNQGFAHAARPADEDAHFQGRDLLYEPLHPEDRLAPADEPGQGFRPVRRTLGSRLVRSIPSADTVKENHALIEIDLPGRRLPRLIMYFRLYSGHEITLFWIGAKRICFSFQVQRLYLLVFAFGHSRGSRNPVFSSVSWLPLPDCSIREQPSRK